MVIRACVLQGNTNKNLAKGPKKSNEPQTETDKKNKNKMAVQK